MQATLTNMPRFSAFYAVPVGYMCWDEICNRVSLSLDISTLVNRNLRPMIGRRLLVHVAADVELRAVCSLWSLGLWRVPRWRFALCTPSQKGGSA